MNIFKECRCIVVGYGSIGGRHARVLQELGCSVAVVSRREIETFSVYSNIAEAVSRHKPDYVVIANETNLHYDSLLQLVAAKYQGAVLIEKPLFDLERAVPAHQFCNLKVAYNLRFHPVIARLKILLADQEAISVHGYVGQYLPNWRPGTDYRHCYSARAEMGGGVLLDLSHDLDYLKWMLGDWERVAALGGQLSALEITSDDIFTLLVKFARCPVGAIQLNYLDRFGRRQIVINTVSHTYEADLIKNRIIVDGVEELFTVDRDDTYRSMHVAMLENHQDSACSTEEALSTLRLINASRQSAQNHDWITQ